MGVKEGFGKYFWAKDNASYQGEWKGNHIAGLGSYHWGDGRTY